MAKKPVVEETVVEAPVVVEAPAAPESTAVMNWEDQLAKYAAVASESEDLTGGAFLSLKAGRLAINGQQVAGNALDCIVVAHAYENAYYVGKYDPQNPNPPKCYAFGNGDDKHAEDNMVPHANVAEPESDACATCPKNEWGSDPDGGRGKACKNTRRLALMPADIVNNPEKIVSGEQIYLKLPVTSVKTWGAYVHAVSAQDKRPPFAVVTTISTEPDAKSQFKVTLSRKSVITDQAAIGQLVKAHELALESVQFPYPAYKAVAKSEKF